VSKLHDGFSEAGQAYCLSHPLLSILGVVAKVENELPLRDRNVERIQSQGVVSEGGDCRKAIQPAPLGLIPQPTLVNREKTPPFLLPNGERKSLGKLCGRPFQKSDKYWGTVRRRRGKARSTLEKQRHFDAKF